MLSAVPVTSNCPVRRPPATAGRECSAWQRGAQPGELIGGMVLIAVGVAVASGIL